MGTFDGGSATPEQLQSIQNSLEASDLNGDDRIDLQEFAELFKQLLEQQAAAGRGIEEHFQQAAACLRSDDILEIEMPDFPLSGLSISIFHERFSY